MKISIKTLLLTVFLVATMSISVLASNSYTEYDVAHTQSLPICGLYEMKYTVSDFGIDLHQNWYVTIEPYDGTNLLFTSTEFDTNYSEAYTLYPTDNPLIWAYNFGSTSYFDYISFSEDGTQLVWPRNEEGTSYLKKIA